MSDACSINADGISYIANAIGVVGIAFAIAWAIRGKMNIPPEVKEK